jgi:tRNA(fMet)-specific endonuclease VapC
VVSRAVYLLDSDICIHALNGHAGVVARIDRQLAGRVVTSAIVWGELTYGALKSRQRGSALQRLEALRDIVAVQPVTAEAGAHYGEIHLALSAEGRLIGVEDLWIAAHARSEGLCIVTNNEREFRRVPGLKVENWLTAA